MAHTMPIPLMLDHPPGMIHLTLPEWFARLLFVAPIDRNALPVEGTPPTIVAAVSPENVCPRLSAHYSLVRSP